ncbi:hypothetical protein E4U48_004691 [Claviceps purpurea]|nr:hypothetical protein E4U10_007716 [Claviceps purpurea]KAG6237399.1 hypothetical protein E4U25_002731 [Claviceps purpurea]KAG6268417.1 hypothetical protein E4U48_004691 [Claviceps purpurea]KAG6324541.1 hypothetical protein E4U44_000738 [Claviceps purpurea]
MAFQQPRMHSISSSSDAMTECTGPSIYPDTVAYSKVPYSAYYGSSLLSPTSLTHSPAMQNSQMVLGGAMDQYSGPGTPNDYEMSNWPRTPFEHHGHPHYFGLPGQTEMGPGLEVSVPWQEIDYSETTSVVTPKIKRERRSRSKTPPKRNTNGVQKRRATNSRKPKRVQKQEDVTEFPQRIEGPPLLREDCPPEEQFLVETRYRFEGHKGTNLWEIIPDLFEARFKKRPQKAALQMKIRRARQTFIVWSPEDEEKLRQAFKTVVGKDLCKYVLEEFHAIGGSRNMGMNNIDIAHKCQEEAFVAWLRAEGMNDYANDFDKDKKSKQARNQ